MSIDKKAGRVGLVARFPDLDSPESRGVLDDGVLGALYCGTGFRLERQELCFGLDS